MKNARLLAPVLALSLAAWLARPAVAQRESAGPAELSTAIRVDEIDSATRGLLERVKALVAEKQWDEAVESLRQIMEKQGGRLVRMNWTSSTPTGEEHCYVPIRDYCQMRLAALPPAGLALYRSRVDPLAKRWFDEGVARRDADLLRRVTDEFLLSSWGDHALMALGEIALEQADYQQARWCWERISPELRAADGLAHWRGKSVAEKETQSAADENRSPPAKPVVVGEPGLPLWLAYPDTKLNLADVRARLVLCSIMEGSLERAREELRDLNHRHPGAQGRIAGSEGLYSELLEHQLTLSASRPAPPPSTDWLTFAGSPERTTIAAPHPALRTVAWRIPLPIGELFRPSVAMLRAQGLPERRPAEDKEASLRFHPLVVGDLVLFNTQYKIFAFNLRTGRPAWPASADDKEHEPGEIYTLLDAEMPPDPRGSGSREDAGVPRFTMTTTGRRLFARLGDPFTSGTANAGFAAGSSSLVCLDLAAEGRLVWRIPQNPAENGRWAFEGSPISDGANVYVAMRYGDVRPQEHVACFDAQTGALRWRRFVCAAESPARGNEEITHNLLTLAHDTLYLNTNLGAVASLATADGQIHWISLYKRAQAKTTTGGNRGANFYRDLNPCIYYRGSLFVAPTDYEGILALDAATGRKLWDSPVVGVVHLLGVGGGNLIASGDQLWWFNVDGGKARGFPDNSSRGAFGRGVLVGDEVYFPMRTEIRVFRQATGPSSAGATNMQVREPIERDGGNLVVAGGRLLIARSKELVVLGTEPVQPNPDEHELTRADEIDSAPRADSTSSRFVPAGGRVRVDVPDP